MVTGHEPAATTEPGKREQLVYSQVAKTLSAAPLAYRPIQSLPFVLLVQLTVSVPPPVTLPGLALRVGGANGLSLCRPNHTKRGTTLLHVEVSVLAHGPCWVKVVATQLFPVRPALAYGRTVRK